MEKRQFKITINASREKVWNILWSESTYSQWTSVFAEGSKAETDNWKKGSKVLFLDGKGSGMVSTIVENKPNEFMSFKHLGTVKNGKEDLASVNEWAGSLENYTLETMNGKTELIVEMDISEEYMDYFLKTWPAALQKLKELVEGIKN
jgi:hypothetical protein